MSSTRSKQKDKQSPQATVAAKKAPDNSWILCLKKDIFDSQENVAIITLPHPVQGKMVKYCLDKANGKIYEIMTYDEPYRSWFIGETVKSDGKIYYLTPVNPTFLVLPLLRNQCKTRAVPLEDLLTEKDYIKIFDYVTSLDHVADLKGAADMKAYKYNEEKTLSWLQGRVEKVAEVLKAKNVQVSTGAVSSTFVTSTRDEGNLDEEFYLKYSHGIISDYLEEELVKLLEKRLNFKPDLIETLAKKRKSQSNDSGNDVKKVKTENVDMDQKENSFISPDRNNISTKNAKPAILTTKEKARIKAANGTKTISSFFMKK